MIIKNTPGRTRTCYPLLRRQMLYPDELRGHKRSLVYGRSSRPRRGSSLRKPFFHHIYSRLPLPRQQKSGPPPALSCSNLGPSRGKARLTVAAFDLSICPALIYPARVFPVRVSLMVICVWLVWSVLVCPEKVCYVPVCQVQLCGGRLCRSGCLSERSCP